MRSNEEGMIHSLSIERIDSFTSFGRIRDCVGRLRDLSPCILPSNVPLGRIQPAITIFIKLIKENKCLPNIRCMTHSLQTQLLARCTRPKISCNQGNHVVFGNSCTTLSYSSPDIHFTPAYSFSHILILTCHHSSTLFTKFA